MASEELRLVSAQRIDGGLNPQLVFQDDSLRFGCGPTQRLVTGDHPGSKVATAREKQRQLTGFIDSHFFQPQTTTDFCRSIFPDGAVNRQDGRHNWNVNRRGSTTPSCDGSVGEEDDDEIQDDDDGLVSMEDNSNNNNHSNTSNSNSAADKTCNGKLKHLSSFGLKEGSIIQSGNDNNDMSETLDESNNNQRHVGHYQNSATIGGQLYHQQYMQGSPYRRKEMVLENGCGFSGRKDTTYLGDSGESLRTILSDPLTGALMDDAMILPCGHSFGSGGIQRVIRMKACYTCSQAVSEDLVVPNLSLQTAVRAFRREEELQVNRASKRKRERYEQDKGSYNDSVFMDHSKAKGVQFPFFVSDRVIIKGNKRTPQRFMGREAVVTTQCLNGWYVVKTLDNAESVKLQYRSLAKLSDNQSSKPISSKLTPNWI